MIWPESRQLTHSRRGPCSVGLDESVDAPIHVRSGGRWHVLQGVMLATRLPSHIHDRHASCAVRYGLLARKVQSRQGACRFWRVASNRFSVTLFEKRKVLAGIIPIGNRYAGIQWITGSSISRMWALDSKCASWIAIFCAHYCACHTEMDVGQKAAIHLIYTGVKK